MDSQNKISDEHLKLKGAVESSDDAIFITDQTGLFTYINPAFTKLYGFSAEEVLGIQTPRILKSGVMRPEDYKLFWDKILNRETVRGEIINKSKSGTLLNIESSSNPILNKEGIIIGFIGIQHDITSQKNIEKALAQEQFLVNALLDTLPDHIYFKDLESRFIRNSKSHILSFGYDNPEMVKGKTDFDFFVEKDARKAFDDEQKIIRTGQPISTVEKLTRKDQTDKWFHAIKLPLRDEKDNIIGTFGISRDITEQKRSEDQLFLLANALKSINECVSITDMNDKVIFLNEAFLRTYGFDADDLKEESISQIRSANNPAKIVDEILPATLHGGWHGELWNRRKDGSEFMVSLSTSVVRNNSGEPIALIGVASDITQRKRMESLNSVIYEITQGITSTSNLDELLKLVHISLSKIVYAENIFVALYEPETDLFSFPYFVDKFDDVPPPTAMKKSCTSYVYRTGKPLLLSIEKFDRLVSQNEVVLVGSSSPSWVGIPLNTPSKTIGVMVLQHYEEEEVFKETDLNFLSSIGNQIAIAIERKQSEVALLVSERDLNESQKIAGLGSYKLNLKTGKWTSSKILDSIFGIDQMYDHSIAGWLDLVHPDWKSMMTEYFQNDVITNHGLFNKEYKIIRKSDSAERWVHGRGELFFDSDNNLSVMVGNIVDITDRKQSEEELNHKNILLQKTNLEKDKFFSILAHDLRGPLSSFVAATQILSEDIKSMTLEDIGEISGNMRDSATDIYALLENLLEWSRLQRGAMEFTPEVFNLKKEISDSIKVLTETARKKELKLTISVFVDFEIFADRHMFATVVRNLVSNAIKFTHKGGEITVEAIQSESETLVKITDTGIGIPDIIKNKLFTLDGTTNRRGTDGESSTGLGLLLCKEFVEKHNGVIRVESEAGKGSTFSFTLSRKNNQKI